MIRSTLILISVLAVSGCVSYSEPMENAAGGSHVCDSSGVSAIGARMAAGTHERCQRALMLLGYLPSKNVGETGIESMGTDSLGKVRVQSVRKDSPAAVSNITTGTALLRVDGQRVSGEVHAKKLLFGLAGTDAEVYVQQSGTESLRLITRTEKQKK